MKKEEKNLLVCTVFLSLAVSESNTHYRLTNDQIVKLLGAKGIKALPAKKFNSEDNAALDWKLGDFLGQKRLAPPDNLLYQTADENYAVRFTQYTYVSPEKSEDNEFSSIDREENQDNRSEINQLYVMTEEKTVSQNKIYNIDDIDLKNFTLEDMNKILDARYFEYLAREDTHDEAVSFLDQEFHTEYVDDIIEDIIHPSKIFKIPEKSKVEDTKILEQSKLEDIFYMNTESTGTSNPHSTVQDPVEPMHYEVGGRRPLGSSGRSLADPNKSYKFHGNRRPLDMSIQLQPVNNQGTLLDLARFDPWIWQVVIERWEKDAVKAWITNPYESTDMWEYMETLLEESVKLF